jgi:hypothetical protein
LRIIGFWVSIFLLSVPAFSGAVAQGERERRLAADLIVISGDLRRLGDETFSEIHRRGLWRRIQGGVAVLGLEIRQARNMNPLLPPSPPGLLDAVFQSARSQDIDGVRTEIAELSRLYPFRALGILPADGRPAGIDRARSIYESYCAGCHDDPDMDVARPAWNLFSLALKISQRELAARLIVGVRGDSLMALDNPLTDAEISTLVAFLRK